VSEAKGRLVAVANLKGGSGKSTVAVHLAGALAERGHRVALLDADPQRTAFLWARRVGLPIRSEREALDSVVEARRAVTRLLGLLDSHAWVVLDLPSVIGPAVASALLLGHVVLIPVAPTPLDIEGTIRTLRYARIARETRGERAAAVRLVPIRVGRADRAELCLQERLSGLGERLAPPIGEHPRLAECFAAGVWIGAEPACAAAHEEFHRLAEAVEGLAAAAPDAPLLVQARRVVEPAPAPLRRPLRHLAAPGRRSFWRFGRRHAGRAADGTVPLGT
jgi:chromosome partitioning protein